MFKKDINGKKDLARKITAEEADELNQLLELAREDKFLRNSLKMSNTVQEVMEDLGAAEGAHLVLAYFIKAAGKLVKPGNEEEMIEVVGSMLRTEFYSLDRMRYSYPEEAVEKEELYEDMTIEDFYNLGELDDVEGEEYSLKDEDFDTDKYEVGSAGKSKKKPTLH